MTIAERELRVAPSAPLRAWRLFRVRTQPGGFALSSPMYDDPDPTIWPRGKRAHCTEPHPAPAPGCRCGIYAIVRGTLDSLPGYLLDTAYDSDPPAYAEVACSGRVFVDARGIRAERAEIARIALVESAWAYGAGLARATRRLAEHYAVPVGGLEDVPDWVTANLRGEGPPPEGATLDLDTIVRMLERPARTARSSRG